MTIQTVFFDMGGTIDTFWYSPEMRLQATGELQALLKSHGIHTNLSDRRLYRLITGGLARYHRWRLHTLDELPVHQVFRKYIFHNYSEAIPQVDPVAENLMVWIETHYYKRQMRPEMPKVLEAIRRMGYKIGLISNVSSHGQVPLNLTQYGIKHYFDPIVLSSEYKRRKPDPSIFHYAARLSNSPASECIYIGDRISRDILGARRAGYRLAIQIKHAFNHGEADEGATPDLILNDMTELLAVLRREAQSSQLSSEANAPERTIRAILFDAEGVLYFRKHRDQELNSFIRRYGSPCKENLEQDINNYRHLAFTGQLTFEEYKTRVLELYGIHDPLMIARGLRRAAQDKEKIHFFSDTLDTLTRLKNRHLYLGIVTDTAQPLHMKIDKLERGGFGHIWDTIIPSAEVGVQKPDPKIYQLALQQLGLTANRAIFVGHKQSELDGARNVGIKTVAFNYGPDIRADFYIEKFSELADLEILDQA